MSLTRQQLQVLEAFREFSAQKGRSPTYRELQVKLGYNSPSSAYNRIQHLIARGYLQKGFGSHNTLREVKHDESSMIVTIFVDQRGTLVDIEAPSHITVQVRRKNG